MFGRAALAVALSAALSAGAQAALVAQWDFDELAGSTAAPTVGAVSGTLLGDASFVGGGITGGAISMTRLGSGMVDFGTGLFPSGPFSVQAWVKTTDAAAGAPFSHHTATNVSGWILALGDINDGCGGGAATASFYVAYPCSGHSGTALNDGVWHQLVGTYDGTQSRIYVDGVLASTSAGGNPLNTPPATTHLLAGGATVGSTPANSYGGLLDKMAIWDTALSGEAVAALHEAATTPTTTTPEPGTLALLGAGALGLARLRRRK